MKFAVLLCAAMLAAPCVHADTARQLMAKAGKAKLILIGEMHGTREVPALVADLAARWSRADAPVLVALEYPQSEAAELQAFVDGDGGAPARTRLLATPFWSRPAQDGRSSAAMLALVDALRARHIRIAVFDMSAAQEQAQAVRDRAMADNLRAIVRAHPASRVIALTGNYHARQVDGAPWDASYRFMGGYLKDLTPLSINVDALRGSYWGCSGATAADCKVENFGNDPVRKDAVGVRMDPATLANGYALDVLLAQFSASLPAKAMQ
jgi:erythromycin esterase-like protein